MSLPKLSKEQIAQARQVDLLTYLRCAEPENLKHTGRNEYRTVNHGSLCINSEGVWHWFAGGFGGRSALDYLTKVEQMPFLEAAHRVLSFSGQMASLPESQRLDRRPKSDKAPKPFCLPARCSSTERIEAYLTGRGIDADLVQHCIQNGSIYEEYPHHNVVFVGRDNSGKACYASMRGTLPGSHFKLDVPGSAKDYNFLYLPPGCGPAPPWVAYYESPIDALSFVTLQRRQPCCPIGWNELPCLAAGGTAAIPMLTYLKEHPHVHTIFCGFDNDDGGHKGVMRLARDIRADPVLSQQVKHIKVMQPNLAYGKDYNEVLQYFCQPRPPNLPAHQQARQPEQRPAQHPQPRRSRQAMER